MIDYEKYHRDGYGVYTLEELLSPEDIVHFNVLANQARKIPLNNQLFQYTLAVQGFHNHPDWPYRVEVSEVEERLKRVEDEGLHVTQRWYECGSNVDLIKDNFHKIIKKFLVKFYPELASQKFLPQIHYQDSITIYKDGDYTEPHRDGKNQGRVCALLMYLTPEEEYNNGGGELVVFPEDPTDPTPIAQVKPVRGNVVLLDFNNHNPPHGVEKVKNGFIRHSYLGFIWNSVRMDPSIKPKGYA